MNESMWERRSPKSLWQPWSFDVEARLVFGTNRLSLKATNSVFQPGLANYLPTCFQLSRYFPPCKLARTWFSIAANVVAAGKDVVAAAATEAATFAIHPFPMSPSSQ